MGADGWHPDPEKVVVGGEENVLALGYRSTPYPAGPVATGQEVLQELTRIAFAPDRTWLTPVHAGRRGCLVRLDLGTKIECLRLLAQYHGLTSGLPKDHEEVERRLLGEMSRVTGMPVDDLRKRAKAREPA